ncbi:MAG: 3-deoxy-D-manno-octulosonic acid transferase [Holosporales bacterium]
MIIIYNLLMIFFRFVFFILNPLFQLKKNDLLNLSKRLKIIKNNIKKDDKIWLHGDSIGEVQSIIPIIYLLKKKHRHHLILITTMTKTGGDLIKSKMPDGCIHQILPFDDIFSVKSFLNYWNPQRVIAAESFLWPNILRECKKRGIKIKLMSAKLSLKSYTTWKRFNFFSKHFFKLFDCVLAQTEEHQKRYIDLGAQNVLVMPTLKYLNDPLKYDEESYLSLSNQLKNRPILCAVSTHLGEEDLLLKTYLNLQKKYPDLLLIIIPRHIDRVGKILNEMHFATPSLKIQQRSSALSIDPSTHLYIVDTFGEVGLFLKLATVVILGGTFVNIGGHNPLEPLMLGARLIVGPYHQNIKDLVLDLKDCITIVQDNKKLESSIDNMMHDMDSSLNVEESIKNIIAEKRNTLNTIIEQYVL